MRIYFDTEFTQFRDGQLLSAGFVADDDRFLYVEIDEPVRRVAEWLLGFGRRVVLSYDYKLDWVFLEATIQAAALWSSVATVVEAHNVAYEASQESALAAQESYLDRASWPGRHHAGERCRFVSGCLSSVPVHGQRREAGYGLPEI